MEERLLAKHFVGRIIDTVGSYNDVRCVAYDARELDIHSLEVFPNTVEMVHSILKNSQTQICAKCEWDMVLIPEITAKEIKRCSALGADSFLIPCASNMFLSGEYDYVFHDLQAAKQAAGSKQLKVDVRAELMTRESVKKICEICLKAGVDCIVPSINGGTYFDEKVGMAKPILTSAEDIQFIRDIVGNQCTIEVQDGVVDRDRAMYLIDAGADYVCSEYFYSIISNQKRTPEGKRGVYYV